MPWPLSAGRPAPVAVVLEAAAQVVRPLHVEVDVVELRERDGVGHLPVPAGVIADLPATVRSLEEVVRVGRVDPHRLVVAMHALRDLLEGPPAILALVQPARERVHDVRVDRVDADVGVVERPEVDVPVVADHLPRVAAVIGAPELTLVLRLGDHVDDVRVGPVDRDADAVHRGLRQPAGVVRTGQLRPRLATVAGPVERGLTAAGGEVPRPALVRVHAGVDDVGVVRVDVEVGAAGEGVPEEDPVPRLPAIGGLEDAALLVGAPRRAQGADVHHVGVARVDAHPRDLLGVLQPDLLPGTAGVERLVDAVAHGRRIARVPLAGAEVEDVRVRRRDLQGADGRVVHLVEEHRPGDAAVHRLHQPTRRGPDVIHGAIPRHADDHRNATGLVGRADRSPPEAADGRQLGRVRDRRQRRGSGATLRG